MTQKYLFADECGNFDFSAKNDASRYFILATVVLTDCSVGSELLNLRRQLARRGELLDIKHFHASQDKQWVRDKVFGVLADAHFRVDATILEKRKAFPAVRKSDAYFYQHAWWNHMRRVAPAVFTGDDDPLIVASSLGSNAKQHSFHSAVKEVMAQVIRAATPHVAFWPCASEPCLQVADYCAWAIQRKWEAGDARSYELIKNRIGSEADLYASGTTYYY